MRKLLLAVIAVGGVVAYGQSGTSMQSHQATTVAAKTETYRLVHATGKSERVLAAKLDLRDCRKQQDERKRLVAMIGAGGSVTCLLDSLFD